MNVLNFNMLIRWTAIGIIWGGVFTHVWGDRASIWIGGVIFVMASVYEFGRIVRS